MREFYYKDIIARSFFGFIIGVGASIYLYGPDPDIKTSRNNDKEGRAVIQGKEIEKSSLEYSVLIKRQYHKKNDFLPGKIRDE